MNHITRIALVLNLLCWALSLNARQLQVRGMIKDKTTGAPLAGAAVYINNSTYTSICDAAGRFVFEKIPALPFELTVSAVGYETGTLKITAANAGQNHELGLELKVVSLDEVKVGAPVRNGWALYGQRFTEALIGYSGFAADCKILNKEVVQFRYDAQKGLLTAWTEKPLRIRNKATGYEITYWLDDFELELYENRLLYKGYAYFSALPLSGKKAARVAENRRSAFLGSFSHFVRSLYKGNAQAEGFEIRVLKKMTEGDADRYIPRSTDTLAWADTVRQKQLFTRIFGADSLAAVMTARARTLLKQWKDDSSRKEPLRLKGNVQPEQDGLIPVYAFIKDRQNSAKLLVKYYEWDGQGNLDGTEQDTKLLNPQDRLSDRPGINGWTAAMLRKKKTLTVLFTGLVPLDSILTRTAEKEVILHFPDYLQVTYTKEQAETAYLERNSRTGFFEPGQPQVSVISLHNPEGIHLLEDGNFYEAYDLLLEQYWSYEKLDKLMPLDYNP